MQATGREALEEMRRLLGVLRGDGHATSLAPQPAPRRDRRRWPTRPDRGGADGHPRRSRATPRPLPPGVELSAYRIVQEALTNVRKHAGRPPGATSWCATATPALELEVADDGRGPRPGDGRGHGLIGMRERVAFFGGEFSAGPATGGGFVVRARLPARSARP